MKSGVNFHLAYATVAGPGERAGPYGIKKYRTLYGI